MTTPPARPVDLGTVSPHDLPVALAAVHLASAPGDRIDLHLPPVGPSPDWPGPAPADGRGPDDDPAADAGPRPGLVDLLVGAGLGTGDERPGPPRSSRTGPTARAVRQRSLPDTIGPGMALLVCGLNPSEHAADAGVGFVSPSNRFWPAALEAGLVERDRDPADALASCGIGMTDLVKRATPRADALTVAEYRAGVARLARACRWLRPGAVCFVGLAGWRAAVDRRATPGPQPGRLGGVPVYVLPSTSGLNARTSRRQLVDHLSAARELGGGRIRPPH